VGDNKDGGLRRKSCEHGRLPLRCLIYITFAGEAHHATFLPSAPCVAAARALYPPCTTRWFWREGSLNKLTRAHLVRLVKACNTVPPFKKATAKFAPRSSLVSWLQNEASSLRYRISWPPLFFSSLPFFSYAVAWSLFFATLMTRLYFSSQLIFCVSAKNAGIS